MSLLRRLGEPRVSGTLLAWFRRTGDIVRRVNERNCGSSAPQKHVWRAKVILATADGCGTAEIMRRSGKSKPVVWTWQARFMAEGVEGLLRDKTRKPGKPPLPPNTVQRVVDLALGPPSGESTHWTGRELAKAAGVSLRSVQRILEAHQLAPLQWRRRDRQGLEALCQHGGVAILQFQSFRA
jgi:transposase